MARTIMHGCNGAMGQVITGLTADDKDIEVIAGTDLRQGTDCDYPVFTFLGECDVNADVIIDFASAKVVDRPLKFSAETGTPVVLCTTGLSQKQLVAVERTNASAAVLCSANISLGVSLPLKLIQDAVRVSTGSGFDIETVEEYHNQKVDTPNGTTIALTGSMNGAIGDSHEYIYDRSEKREKRSPKETGIGAVRGGSIVGEHDVIFADRDRAVTFGYTAYFKAISTKGVLGAARFLAGKGPGLYTTAGVVRL